MILEFSHVQNPILRQLYDTYSFNVIPRIGGIVANDSESYQYLVESIRRFPTQVFFNFFIFFYISFTIFSFIYLHNLSSFLPSVSCFLRLISSLPSTASFLISTIQSCLFFLLNSFPFLHHILKF